MRRSLLPFLALFPVLAGCIRQPEPPPPARPVAPTPSLHGEENLQPDPTVRLEIIGLEDAIDPATKRVRVTGTLINRGTRATSQVSVRVDALDEKGDSVLSLAAVPSTDRIAAGGGTATFTAEFDDNAAIRSYHVEAIAR